MGGVSPSATVGAAAVGRLHQDVVPIRAEGAIRWSGGPDGATVRLAAQPTGTDE